MSVYAAAWISVQCKSGCGLSHSLKQRVKSLREPSSGGQAQSQSKTESLRAVLLEIIFGRLFRKVVEDEDHDDEDFNHDELRFRNLNPEQSVERHYRRRFEAAAQVVKKGDAAYKEFNKVPKKHLARS
ncbi:uncharacterized protein LOC108104048 [Drosophila eugracilis]|uniref:uncharacterized protein LOC108104048 n=1 Tax=Drosophila eugracilis TaxID=29029 RepID=UPI001BDAC5AE|nr:uncharacterized protein LOC108104048 [Drosophila eugracilis]